MGGSAYPRVSAALIVKNEEAFLPGCLDSLKGRVDELVIVDTGSADATPEIALDYGACLIHYPWTDDFSAARNAGLDAARGDWILYIDADERLDLSAEYPISFALSNGAAAACVQFIPKRGFTRYREPRLFLNRPDVRFRGPIHESVMHDVNRLCSEQGYSILHTDIKLDHLGYEADQSSKHARNLPLLEVAISEQPERIYYYYHLAETLVALGHMERAAAVGYAGLIIAGKSNREKDRADASLIYQLLARLNAPAHSALELLEEGLARYPLNYALRFQLAEQLIQHDQPEHAVPHLEILISINPEQLSNGLLSFHKQIFGKFAWQLLGKCYLAMGRNIEAMLAFRAALPDLSLAKDTCQY